MTDDSFAALEASTDKPKLGMLSPPGHEQTVFQKVQLPDNLFMMTDADDNTDGPYDPADFIDEPETNIAISRNGDGHPVILRVLYQDGMMIRTVDGLGREADYTMSELPDNELAIEDPFTPPSQFQLAIQDGD